ncbi:hypothetical protein Trydic_g14001 [Trypoxylus dichotomus]
MATYRLTAFWRFKIYPYISRLSKVIALKLVIIIFTVIQNKERMKQVGFIALGMLGGYMLGKLDQSSYEVPLDDDYGDFGEELYF